MSIDQRGFKTIIQGEAAEFLKPEQLLLNTTVTTVGYSDSGVYVKLSDGTTLHADYAITTFSLGVLQNDDVAFEPALPDWKVEAIQSMTMVYPVSHRPRGGRLILSPTGDIHQNFLAVPSEILV